MGGASESLLAPCTRAVPHAAVALHPIHSAVHALVQPLQQMGFRFAKIGVAYAGLLKAQLAYGFTLLSWPCAFVIG